MDRRQFLSASLGSWVVACSARTELEPEPTADRAVVSQWPGRLTTNEALFPQSLASGDPKPRSVMLWTRTPSAEVVYAQVALDADFNQLVALESNGSLVAEVPVGLTSHHDHCAKLRVEGLSPNTTYYYRFVVETADGVRTSRTGRTKTAPDPSDHAAPRFAVLSCQDYSGYYHALRRVVELAPDFVVHLGDYIYETTSDPSFQSAAGAREVVFRDVAGAKPLTVTATSGAPSRQILAARSLDNYRQLYQTYRSDPWLQRLHETAPIIAVCDDHEFANDATADRTPLDHASDPERRLNADQAWFEYLPVDYPEQPELETAPFPDNLRLYRDFRFGKHLHLVMTDLRRYRPPHLIAEDAFPGAVMVDEAALVAAIGEIPDVAAPYVDLDAQDVALSVVRTALTAATSDWNLPSAVFSGKQDLAYLNTWIDRHNTEGREPTLTPLDATMAAGRGLAAIHTGKTEIGSTFGARYLVIQDAYEVLARVRFAESNGASERIMGQVQRDWFVDTLQSSTATWKVWGNEYTFLRKIADLSALPLPDERLKHRFLLSVEDWDGAPNERLALLSELSAVRNLAIVTGDIHSFFVGKPGVEARAAAGQPLEFVCGAVTSATYSRLLSSQVQIEGLEDLAAAAAAILTLSNPHVSYNDLDSNGFAMVEVGPKTLEVTFHALPAASVLEPALDGALEDHFTTQVFTWNEDGSLDHDS